MVDVEIGSEADCPVVKVVKEVMKEKTTIYRVTWQIYNLSGGHYHVSRKERFFKTIEAANRFATRRKEAAELLGLVEGLSVGEPVSVFLEDN